MSNLIDIISKTKDLKLLYVEDDKNIQISTISILEEFFDCITVKDDGKDGLEAFKTGFYDLIITDINMPNMTGIEMIKELRKYNKNIPVIVLTAYTEELYHNECILLGINWYLNKPLQLKSFIEILTKFLDIRDVSKQMILDDNIFQDQFINGEFSESMISIIDINGVIIHVNKAFCAMAGYKKEELVNRPYHTITNYKQSPELFNEIWTKITIKKETWSGVVKYISNTGEEFFLDGTIRPIQSKNNEIIGYIAIRDDITSKHKESNI